MEKVNPIYEARIFINNARTILKENACKTGELYKYPEHIKIAGKTAWKGVLIALDAVLNVKKKTKKDHQPNISEYKEAASEIDQNIYEYIEPVYNSLYKAMGYDGNTIYNIVQEALKSGDFIIDCCERILTTEKE